MKTQITNRHGFTLMEIMVVIIVIAVLASVAGPMIGSITDQGRASATKSKLAGLKSALLAFQSDLGRFPHDGNAVIAESYNNASGLYLSNLSTNNVLVNNALNLYATNYQRRYKGPYMDDDPENFMHDGWGNFMTYFAVPLGNNVYLRSNGINGDPDSTVADSLNQEKQDSGEADDIVMSVTRTRRAFQ